MTSEVLTISKYLPYRLAVVSRKLSLALEKTYGEKYGLSRPEWRTLALLQEKQVSTGAELAAMSGMDPVAIHRAIKGLEQKQLIKREALEGDARAKSVSLTSQGQKVFREIAPHALVLEKKLLDLLGPANAKAFAKAMEVLVNADL